MNDDQWRGRFPDLYRVSYIDYADCRINYTTSDIEDHLVSRLHLMALTPDGQIVVCRSAEGGRFLPGGTREPEESLIELARRELLEEAGAELIGEPRLFSSHVADSLRDEPYRPHLPFPRSFWAYAVADVAVRGEPSNPDDGEVVVEVLTLPVDEAVDYLQAEDPLHADVLRHATALGLLSTDSAGRAT